MLKSPSQDDIIRTIAQSQVRVETPDPFGLSQKYPELWQKYLAQQQVGREADITNRFAAARELEEMKRGFFDPRLLALDVVGEAGLGAPLLIAKEKVLKEILPRYIERLFPVLRTYKSAAQVPSHLRHEYINARAVKKNVEKLFKKIPQKIYDEIDEMTFTPHPQDPTAYGSWDPRRKSFHLVTQRIKRAAEQDPWEVARTPAHEMSHVISTYLRKHPTHGETLRKAMDKWKDIHLLTHYARRQLLPEYAENLDYLLYRQSPEEVFAHAFETIYTGTGNAREALREAIKAGTNAADAQLGTLLYLYERGTMAPFIHSKYVNLLSKYRRAARRKGSLPTWLRNIEWRAE